MRFIIAKTRMLAWARATQHIITTLCNIESLSPNELRVDRFGECHDNHRLKRADLSTNTEANPMRLDGIAREIIMNTSPLQLKGA